VWQSQVLWGLEARNVKGRGEPLKQSSNKTGLTGFTLQSDGEEHTMMKGARYPMHARNDGGLDKGASKGEGRRTDKDRLVLNTFCRKSK
jgi:hypothetical protein